jgi:hypothetical protein
VEAEVAGRQRVSGISIARPTAVPVERARVATSAALATVASLAIFITAQTLLLLRAHHLMWEAFLLQNGPHYANDVVGSVWPDLLLTTGRFCGLMLAGITLAVSGRRRAYAVPAIAWFLLSMTHGPALVHLPHPAPIGVGWGPVSGTAIGSPFVWMNQWVGSVIDYTLALLPAAVLASGLRHSGMLRPADRRWPPITSVATFTLCVFVLLLTMLALALSVDSLYPWAQVPAMVPLFLFGALLGTRWPSLLWTAAAVPLLIQVDWFSLIHSASSPLLPTLLSPVPFVVVVGLGLAPGPAARALERLRESPLSALILLNVLNVADAVLTWAAIDTNQAAEANPVVRMLGLPAKVMLVAAISLVLYRRQPRAIAWTVLVFIGVIAWHVAGLYFTAHT